ncbi:uncharacterized protein MONBRDRAFT_25293 [Monosiga brevicollis MX1]|uniref:Mbre TPR repeat protein n=1 Tax=Monosiga brevicollis TaxID=81824 RepID=A9UYZ4_MONBE|nr:uncharacterized protein MONBRDRAFT_25293 [Monosiga brevicollis MX1]EDQ89695.1 predicted protein [Monosiga brevicollis MX1]|eukprot:XP_001745724.1 hypothetical protein [Monosiga brevicollis MX1]
MGCQQSRPRVPAEDQEDVKRSNNNAVELAMPDKTSGSIIDPDLSDDRLPPVAPDTETHPAVRVKEAEDTPEASDEATSKPNKEEEAATADQSQFLDPKLNSRALLGVSAAYLRGLEAALREEFGDEYENLTTTEVCVRYVMPRTKARACAMIDVLLEDPALEADVAPATVFVSHAWKYKFHMTLGTILHHETMDAPGAFYWLDLIPNNQHQACNYPYAWWSNTFQTNIATIGRVLLIMSPWNDPIPMTRAWCLFEMMNALNCQVQLDIRLPTAEIEGFLNALGENADEVLNMLVRVQAQKAEAFQPNDRDMIFKTIEDTLGFTKLNARIKDQLRAWCIDQARVAARDALAAAPQSDNTAKICFRVGSVLGEFGQIPDAMAHYDRAIDIVTSTLGPKHPNMISLLAHKALTLKQQGQYDAALQLFAQSLDTARAAFGDQHPSIASTHNNMALVYKEQGRLDEALAAYTQAHQQLSALLGAQHPEVANVLSNMAVIHKDRGQFATAIQLYEQAANILRATVGEQHPAVAHTYNNLAVALEATADFARALDYHRRALDIRITTLGERHEDTAASFGNMAVVHQRLGHLAEAEQAMHQALAILLEVVGDKHPAVASTLNNLALVYKDQGKQEEQLACYQKALAMQLAALGERHPAVALSRNNIANILNERGDLQGALEGYNKAIEIYTATIGELHPETGAAYGNLATVYQRLGQIEPALACVDKALGIQIATLGEQNPRTGLVAMQMSGILEACGLPERAIICIQKAQAIFQATLGPNHEYTRTAAAALAAHAPNSSPVMPTSSPNVASEAQDDNESDA